MVGPASGLEVRGGAAESRESRRTGALDGTGGRDQARGLVFSLLLATFEATEIFHF